MDVYYIPEIYSKSLSGDEDRTPCEGESVGN